MSNAQVGRVISRFISSKWQCLRHLLEVEGKGEKLENQGPGQGQGLQEARVASLLEEAMEDMTIGSGASDIAIFQTLEIMVPHVRLFDLIYTFIRSLCVFNLHFLLCHLRLDGRLFVYMTSYLLYILFLKLFLKTYLLLFSDCDAYPCR